MPHFQLTLTLRRGALATALALIGSTACADAQSPSFVPPNEHLRAEGIPPIPSDMAAQVARYSDFRPRVMVDWHPVRREMLVSTRTKGTTTQLHLLRKPMGELEQLTDFPDPVRNASFEPNEGKYIVFEKDEGGSEASQLYRLDLDSRKITLLTDPKEKHSAGAWNHAGNQLLQASTQLDKTASGASRSEVTTDLWLLDPLKPESKRKIVALPGGGWGEFKWSPDDSRILALNYKSANESSVWLINLPADGAAATRRQILPAPGSVSNVTQAYASLNFSLDGKHLLLTTDREGEFQQFMKVDLATLKMTPLSKHIAWDVSDVEPSKLSNQVAAVVNNDGLSELHLFDAVSGKELARPKLPVGAVSHVKWRQDQEIAFDLNSARSPGDLYSYDPKTGAVEQWTAPAGAMDTSAFRDQSLIRWTSFDQRTISGLIAKPPASEKFKGPRPVLVLIHGGPEGQASIGFLGRYNYLLNELGVVLIQPNVRGSSGYGKTFLKLDNGFRREDSVKDIGALFDWIATQPDLDPKRVAVMGGSYGGYMSLAVSTHYADRIVGSIDVVGISNFVSFLERTESYRRDLRRVEYGDEREPKMRAFLEQISPLNNAQKITKPLFVVQGKNDPRVPLNEAEQIVARVRKNEVPVWYLMADNEGHGFARKPNADFYFYSVVKFAEEYLLK